MLKIRHAKSFLANHELFNQERRHNIRKMALKSIRLVASLSLLASGFAFGGARGYANSAMRRFIPAGLCAVYKPKGCTSADVVAKVKRVLEQSGKKVKVGHGGTLDPMAEGVLVLGIGDGTKQLSNYLSGSKGYTAVGLLGTAFDTLDITGKETSTASYDHVTTKALDDALSQFRGDIKQLPPMYSALKSKGKRLYELAREGVEVERELRDVSVYSLELLPNRKLPEFELQIECSGGFYVRSLIADVSTAVNTVGCMSELVRTKQAMFHVSDCLHQEDWTTEKLSEHIVRSNALVEKNVASTL